MARADHDHGISGGGSLTFSSANPVNTPGSPGPGSAATPARSDHDHGITNFVGVSRNATLTGTGVNSANALGIAIPLHSTVVQAIADQMRGTTPLSVSVVSGNITVDAADLVSQIAALRARVLDLENA